MATLETSQDMHKLVRLAAAGKHKKIREITDAALMAGLQIIAPEVLEDMYNATSDIPPEALTELFPDEKTARSKLILRRAR